MPRKGKQNGGFTGRTHIALVWDETGSIIGHNMRFEAKNALKEQLKAARKGERVKLTVWFFGTQYEGGARAVITSAEPTKVDDSFVDEYQPNASTPLYDAVGRAIEDLESRVEPGDRALVCVFTDGEENSSRTWTQEKVAGLISRKQAEGNWTVTFAAAGFDKWVAERLAGAMAMHAGSTQSAPATAQGMRTNSAAMASSTSSYLASSDANRSESFYSGSETEKPKPKKKSKTQ